MSGSVPDPTCLLTVRATARAKANRLELASGKVKAWVTAAPTDGQANEAIRTLIAKLLGIAPSRVNLERGAASRDKTFRVSGLSLEDVLARLEP